MLSEPFLVLYNMLKIHGWTVIAITSLILKWGGVVGGIEDKPQEGSMHTQICSIVQCVGTLLWAKSKQCS